MQAFIKIMGIVDDLAAVRDQERLDHDRRLRGAIDFEQYIRNRSTRRKAIEKMVDAMVELRREELERD